MENGIPLGSSDTRMTETNVGVKTKLSYSLMCLLVLFEKNYCDLEREQTISPTKTGFTLKHKAVVQLCFPLRCPVALVILRSLSNKKCLNFKKSFRINIEISLCLINYSIKIQGFQRPSVAISP